MRLLIIRCSVDYAGRLTTRLPDAVRVLMLKADGAVAIHSDGSAKPLNYMPGPTTVVTTDAGFVIRQAKTGETLTITINEVLHDHSHDLGPEPGLVKDGAEKELQVLLADRLHLFEAGLTLVRREYPTPLGPVDFLCRDTEGRNVAIEIKRNGGIDGVDQLTRYLDFLNRDPLLAPVRGIFAAQTVAPQARVLAEDRGMSVAVLPSYETLQGIDGTSLSLF